MKTFINVAQMKLATLQAGQFVETGGYYVKGDAGQAKYLIVAAQTADGYGDHTLANGTVAVLQVGDSINVLQFGAKGNGTTDDSTAIQAAIDYAFSLVKKIDVVIPPSNTSYRYSEIVNKGVLRGTGGVLKQLDNIAVDPAVVYYTLHNFSTVPSAWYDGVKYINLIIDGNGANNPKANFLTFDVITAAGIGTDVIGCTITDSPDSGIMYTFIEQGECSGNTIDGGTDLGIYVNDFEAGVLTDGALVKDNFITNYPNGGIGIKRGTSNASIHNNSIRQCGQGITHEAFGVGAGGNPSKISISNNKLSRIGYPYRGLLQPAAAGEVGFSLIGFHNGSCTDNTIHDVSGLGMNVTGDGFTVNDNKITASDPANILPTADGNIGIIIQSTALDGGITDGILNSNTVTGFRDDGLDIRTVAALQVNGGYYESYGFNGVTIATTAENVHFDGVKAFTSSGAHKDFENLGGQVFARNCVSPTNGFYPFNFQNNLDAPVGRIVSSGTASFAASNSVTFAHGLVGAPVNVQLTPIFNGNSTPANPTFVSAITATNITINTSGGAFTYDVHWLAHRYSPT